MPRLALAALLAVVCSCSRKHTEVPAPPAAGRQSAAAPQPDLAAPESPLPGDEEIKPVYSDFAGAALPLAQKLCAALYELPEARKTACCSAKPGSTISGECARVLSAALRSGSVQLEAAAVDRCAAAQERTLSGCSWVGPFSPPAAPECEGLLTGHRKRGEVCRSSLECGEGLHCLGVGPLNAGKCGPPFPDGHACLTAVDSLATYAREDADLHHPECSGFCGHRKCMPVAAPGAACRIARECSRGQHCDGVKCVAGEVAAAGESCTGGACARGLSCLEGKCAAPKADGAPCKVDAECRGACRPATHVCGMRCL